MSDQGQQQPLRRPSRGEPEGHAALRGEPSRSQSLSQSEPTPNPVPYPVPSIETTAQTTAASQPAPAPQFRVPPSPRSTGLSESSQKIAKVAIPRLKRPVEAASDDTGRGGSRHRVNHACEPCRHRKTKCSGERPVCRHCQDFKIACFYADGKRDRVKKQFGTLTEKVTDYEKLLRDLVARVSDTDASLIRASLDKEWLQDAEVDQQTEGQADTAANQASIDESESIRSGAESEVSAGVGSTGALDRTDEDFTRDHARATGFHGKNSEVTWMQRLREENKYGDDHGSGEGGSASRLSTSRRRPGDEPLLLAESDSGFHINDSSYHLDDVSINTFEAVDPYEMPTPDVATNLFSAYITRVHPSFPIVGKINLTNQFQRFLGGTAQQPPDKWLAIINMIFAIGAKYSHLIKADWKGDERDHLIYFTRARLLSMHNDILFQHPDLQVIQILGLMSFYLLATGQINRAWILNGLAIREASALGMNVRNDSSNLKNSLKEIRYRVWWSLYVMEHRLCNMTGRVNCILDEHCTTPLPIPLDEEQFETEEGQKLLSKEWQSGERAPASNSDTQSAVGSTPSTDRSRSQTLADSRSPSSHARITDLEWAKDAPPNSSLYFLHLVQLTRLTQAIFHRLYNPASIQGSWSEVQSKIKELDEQLEHWYRRLPAPFAFRRNQRERSFYEYRLGLGFFYYSTKMTIHRPCLCRLDRKIPNQSTKSFEFNRQAAYTCVESAMEMLGMIPDEPNAVGLVRVGPWWSILHWLVQAATVLMLEISFRAHHMPEEADAVLESSKKAIRWLHALGEDNPSGRRAWILCFPMLKEAVKKIGRDVDDLPQHPPGRSSPTDAIMTEAFSNPMYQAGAGSTTIYPPMQGMSTQKTFATYDPVMQYDQYFPPDTIMGGQLPFQQSTDAPTDAEMEFMSSAYHENQGHQPQGGVHGQNPGRPPN